MSLFEQYFRQAKEAGLGVTLHIAEVFAIRSPHYPRGAQCVASDSEEHTGGHSQVAVVQTGQARTRNVLRCRRSGCGILGQRMYRNLSLIQPALQDC